MVGFPRQSYYSQPHEIESSGRTIAIKFAVNVAQSWEVKFDKTRTNAGWRKGHAEQVFNDGIADDCFLTV